MRSWNEVLTDWINLPAGIETRSLWVCLHDAELVSIKSDLLKQNMSLEIKAFFMLDSVSVRLHLNEVESVRVNKYPPPYQSLITDEMSWQEKNQIASEWVSKWREESMSWQEFKQALPTDPLEISDADLVVGEQQIALRVGGHLDGEKYDDLWCSVYIRAARIEAFRSDEQDFSLEQFIELGRRWWDSLGNRKE